MSHDNGIILNGITRTREPKKTFLDDAPAAQAECMDPMFRQVMEA